MQLQLIFLVWGDICLLLIIFELFLVWGVMTNIAVSNLVYVLVHMCINFYKIMILHNLCLSSINITHAKCKFPSQVLSQMYSAIDSGDGIHHSLL